MDQGQTMENLTGLRMSLSPILFGWVIDLIENLKILDQILGSLPIFRKLCLKKKKKKKV